MLKRCISILIAASLSMALQPLKAQPTTTLFGPEEFLRGNGQPVNEVRQFSIAGFQGPFVLRLRNGDESGQNRVSSATVLLNGHQLFGPSDFSQQTPGYDVEVELSEPSRLEVQLASIPGSRLTISIEGVPNSRIEARANPAAFFTNTPTLVRVQARILPDPLLDPNSVALLRVDQSSNPVGGSLCSLLDNGDLTHGDDIAGDSTFSCFINFQEGSPVSIRLLVQALLGGQTIFSPLFFIEVVDPLSEEQAQTILSVQQQATAIWQQKLAEFGDTLQARMETANLIKTLEGVADAGVSIDEVTVWIKYESGVNGGLMLNPPGTRGGGTGSSLSSPPFVSVALPATGDTPIENTKVLIWDAYNSEFSPDDEGPDLQQLFQASNCPKFSVTYLLDDQATVNSVKSFAQFGTVILITHGAVDGDGQVVFLTRENTSLLGLLAHAIDLLLGRVSVMGDVYAIRPGLISALSGSFENSVVYNGSCESSANGTMANAFLGKGARTYYGYTRIVNSAYAKSAAVQLFTNMVTDRDNTGDAFNKVMPKVDPVPPNATFAQTGDAKVAYTGDLINGDFEKGDLTGWTRTGDGRVLPVLGEFSPAEGTFMGIISTGLGFTTSSGSIEQNFCLPRTATELAFDWNFNSEEFIEWCGPNHPFDDPFEVELVTETGTTTLFRQTVDTLCSGVTPTALFFDQSGPGCQPTQGVGLGTGGNDCTVWSTGWRSQSVNVSGIAMANDGKGVTLRFKNFDAGDSIFDSAVLLDRIEVVEP